MKNIYLLLAAVLILSACGEDHLEIEPRGTTLESNFYKTQEDYFTGLVAAYDVLQWGGTGGWNMQLGLLNAASDDCHAGGSDASDQPSWVAWDQFTLDPELGPQSGLWNKGFAGIYRANLLLEKLAESEGLDVSFVARTEAEAKFLRAYFYFDLVRFFGRVPLITQSLEADVIYDQTQNDPSEVYAQIESDLNDAIATIELPFTVPGDEIGRITQGAARALLAKVIIYQDSDDRMDEAATLLDDVIGSGIYALEDEFGDIFSPDNEWGSESIFEINHSGNQQGDYGQFNNGTEGNYNVQFFGMRDYVGPIYADGWSFCPVSLDLVEAMEGDPRYEHTIIDGAALQAAGASYTAGFQNTDYFIQKYSSRAADRATSGEPALNWGYNEKVIRLADVLLLAAEAHQRSGNEMQARRYLNDVRIRVSLQPITNAAGSVLLDAIYRERRLELATEGHRFFDLVRTDRAAEALGERGYVSGKHDVLPIPQSEIDISEGSIIQNPGY